MKLEHLKAECPKMPENIRAMIEREVESQMKKCDDEKRVERRFGRKSWKKVVAAALVATMAMGTTVYAGVKLYQMNVKVEGKYFVQGTVAEENAAGELKKVGETYEYPVLSVNLGYIPEGMEIREGPDYIKTGLGYSDSLWNGGMSMGLDPLYNDFSGGNLSLMDLYVTSWEKLDIAGREAVLIHRQGRDDEYIEMDRKLYVAYPEYQQMLTVFLGEDFSTEEAVKLIEGLELKPTGEMYTSEYYERKVYPWKYGDEVPYADAVLTTTAEAMKNTHQIGEEFGVSSIYENLTAKVTNVRIADDFEGLKEEYIGFYMKRALGEDGKLEKNKLTYVKYGDGVNTLNEVVKTEELNQKLVDVTVEFTNHGDAELTDVIFSGTFVGIEVGEEEARIYNKDVKAVQSGEGIDNIEYSSRGRFGEMDYYDIHSGCEDNNHIPSIKPGETITMHIAKILNEDELDKMYMSFDTYSCPEYEFSTRSLQMGYVDIRQK